MSEGFSFSNPLLDTHGLRVPFRNSFIDAKPDPDRNTFANQIGVLDLHSHAVVFTNPFDFTKSLKDGDLFWDPHAQCDPLEDSLTDTHRDRVHFKDGFTLFFKRPDGYRHALRNTNAISEPYFFRDKEPFLFFFNNRFRNLFTVLDSDFDVVTNSFPHGDT